MAKNVSQGRPVPAAAVEAQILAVLGAWGMPDDLAATTARIMVETDLMGIDSHGVSMLMAYEEGVRAGRIRLEARPQVVRDTGPIALMDAGDGLGHPAAAAAMDLACERAARFGIGAVGVRRSHHFGAAGAYARMAMARGLIGLVTSTARGINTVPTRGRVPVLGTNPIAFAAPVARGAPVVLDMATTTVAANKVKVHHLNDAPVPPGWVMDGEGRPVTDPHEANAFVFQRPEGGLTPLGGTEAMGSAKGYGLSLLAHVLAGPLTGAAFQPLRLRTEGAEAAQNIGHFLLAIDPGAFRPADEFGAELADIVDVLHATPPADPAEPVLVPGEPEDRMRAARGRDGIPIPPTLEALLRGIVERCGAAWLMG